MNNKFLGSIISCIFLLGNCTPVSALIFGEGNSAPSMRMVFNGCTPVPNVVPTSPECASYPKIPGISYIANFSPPSSFSIFIDPPVNGITSISLSLLYDPNKWKPVVGSEGFLCSFTSAGNCPMIEPGIGASKLDDIFYFDVQKGAPIGTYALDLSTSGIVTLEALFSEPIYSVSEEIFFTMEMEALFDVRKKIITYIENDDGSLDYDYKVQSFTCVTEDKTNECGSNHPTSLIKVRDVPTPTAVMPFLMGLFVFSNCRNNRKSKKKC